VDLIATELYRFHKDYIGYSISASAFINADTYVTEEKKKMSELIGKLPIEFAIFRKVSSGVHDYEL